MREIKFRAWDKITKQMCLVCNIDYKWWDSLEQPINSITVEIGEDGTVIRFEHEIELMQYTGLKDKNGKEIYEGDVIEHSFSDGEKHAIVVSWCTDENGWDPFSSYLNADGEEVIGNIYENPELLK